MNKTGTLISKLFLLRNRYEQIITAQKLHLLNTININTVKSKKSLLLYYDALLFLIAYPDNKTIYTVANAALLQLEKYVSSNLSLQHSLYNTGVTKTSLCAAFSFEIVKWLRLYHPKEVKLASFESSDEQIRSILTVVMQKIETEKMQESKAAWKDWILQSLPIGQDLLDGFIAVFDNSSIRPEVKDELWNSIGINIEIDFFEQHAIAGKLASIYYHRSIIRKPKNKKIDIKIKEIKLANTEAEQVIDKSRMILIRQLREIDPISFTFPKGVFYYQLPRGYSIALMIMVQERQVPNDCYLGYTVFKNGLPVAYAGSWIMFDSSRIGLNVYPHYRGGEAQYIFQLVLEVHAKVYGLKRFTVDAYQIGKENYDGIHSGAFWVYYHAGFRPIEKEQQSIAEAEVFKIKSNSRYKSSATILKKLADSRMELLLDKKAFCFDAVDLSDLYAAILKKQYKNNRLQAENGKAKKLASILAIKNDDDPAMNYVLKNWALVLLYNEKELINNSTLRKELKKLFALKATGKENDFIAGLQKAKAFRIFLEKIWKEFF